MTSDQHIASASGSIRKADAMLDLHIDPDIDFKLDDDQFDVVIDDLKAALRHANAAKLAHQLR